MGPVGTSVPFSAPTEWSGAVATTGQLERAALVAAFAGDAAAASVLADRAAGSRRTPQRHAPRLRTWTNTSLSRRTRSEEGRELLSSDDALAAAQVAVQLGDSSEGGALAAGVLAGALAAGDHGTAALAALTVAYAGELETGAAALTVIHRDAVRRDDCALAANALAFHARLAWASGDPELALHLDEQALRSARAVHGGWLWTQIAAGLGMMRAARGELDAASASAAELRSTGDALATGVAEVISACVSIERGEAAHARARLEPLLALVRSLGVDLYAIPVLLTASRAEIELRRPERAAALLDEAEAVMWSPIHEQRVDVLMLRARLECDVHGAAVPPSKVLLGAAAFAEEIAGRLGGPAVSAAADHVRGLVEHRRGDVESAGYSFERAAAGWERAPRWTYAAEAWLAAAEMLADVDSGRSASALARGLALAEGRGFTSSLHRASALAARLASGECAGAPLAELTRRERDVVRLAADGHSNQEIAAELFLSALTVRNYLSTAFPKLGISRRSQLAPLLAGRTAFEQR